MSDKLTLTLGLRFDYQFARTESDDQYSTFDPNTPNPGAGGIPGALIFAGDGTNRSGHRTFEDPKTDAWGPRVGFAYRVNDKNVIRGGYGMYYSGVAFSQFVGAPTLGFQGNPFAPNLTNGLQPAFYLDNGFPQDRIVQPPFIDPTFANGGNVIAVAPDGLTLPRFQNWSVTLQHQLTDSHDAGRLVHRESRQPPESPLPDAGRRREHERPERARTTARAFCRPTSTPPSRRHAGIPIPYAGFRRQRRPGAAGVSRSTSRSSGAACPPARASTTHWRSCSSGASRSGLQFRVGYTYSQLHNNGAESAQGDNGINDARAESRLIRSSGR